MYLAVQKVLTVLPLRSTNPPYAILKREGGEWEEWPDDPPIGFKRLDEAYRYAQDRLGEPFGVRFLLGFLPWTYQDWRIVPLKVFPPIERCPKRH